MSGKEEITSASKPIYDPKIDDKEDEKDIVVTPAVLGFDQHMDINEQTHVKE
jgi:hypothetical protein